MRKCPSMAGAGAGQQVRRQYRLCRINGGADGGAAHHIGRKPARIIRAEMVGHRVDALDIVKARGPQTACQTGHPCRRPVSGNFLFAGMMIGVTKDDAQGQPRGCVLCNRCIPSACGLTQTRRSVFVLVDQPEFAQLYIQGLARQAKHFGRRHTVVPRQFQRRLDTHLFDHIGRFRHDVTQGG
jgi:hypothetical protein